MIERRASKKRDAVLRVVGDAAATGLSEGDIKTARKILLTIIENLADDGSGSTNPMRRVLSTRELGKLIAERGESLEDV